jgi:hypothetical protein
VTAVAELVDGFLDAAQRPLYATPRDPLARTEGGQVARIAEALGTPLMPWQRLVADVALERHPDDPRRWRYPLVVVTVPRQAGKTTLVAAVAVHRAITRGRGRVFMTAQKGKDARARWRDTRDRLMDSPLARQLPPPLNGAGTESLRFPGGAEIKPFAPTRDALHGETPPLVIIDEAWSFDTARGEDLMQAIRPAQITLADRQLWILSTAGTAESTFLREHVDNGRASLDDPGSGIAYFEWSAPEGAEPYSPETWRFHPALGHTITTGDLAAEAETSTRANFERAYLNRWTVAAETVVDLEAHYDPRGNEDQLPPAPGTPLALAYAVAQDRSRSSGWASWVDPSGKVQLRAVLVKPGSKWLVDELPKLRDELRPRVIMADDGGPARPVTDELRRRKLDVETIGFRDYATACGAFLNGLVDDQLAHDGSASLRDALAAVRLKFVSDQRAYDRRKSAGPIDPLEAATVAAWAATHAPAPELKPYVYVPKGRR